MVWIHRTVVLLFIVLPGSALADDATLNVRVFGPDGVLIEGAHVWIGEQEQRGLADWASAASETGCDGVAVLRRTRMCPGLRPWHGRYRLVVSAPGFSVAVHEPLYVRADEQSLDVRLEEGVSISGVVLSAAGDPVADAVVRSRTPGHWIDPSQRWFPETRSAADGSFRLDHMNPGVHGLLVASSSGVGWRTARAPSKGIEVVLRPGVTIHGRVDARPAGDVGSLWGQSVPYSCQVPVREGGRFMVENVPPGKYRLFGHVIVVEDEDLELDLHQAPTANSIRVPGSVRTTDGDPVPEALVEAIGPQVWPARTTADVDGHFDLDFIVAGAHHERIAVLATAGTLVGWGFASLDDTAQHLAISMGPAKNLLRVQAVVASTTKPVPEAHVIVRAEWRRFPLNSWTNGDGWTKPLVGFPDPDVFEGDPIGHLPRQQQWVRVRAGFSYLPFERWVRVDGSTEMTASLEAKPSVRGHVEDERGMPLPGIRVVCGDGDADTDANGEFLLLGGRAGATFEDLRWTGLPRKDPTNLPNLPPDPARPGVFVLRGVHRIDLSVKFGPEWEGWQAVLGLEGEQAPLFPRADIDQTGQARFGIVYEGNYVIWARSPAGDRIRNLGLFKVAGDPGSVVTVDLTDDGAKAGGR